MIMCKLGIKVEKNMQKISKFRGIDTEVYKFLKEKKQATRYELRKRFIASGEGAVRFSISSLHHKDLVDIQGDKIILKEPEINV